MGAAFLSWAVTFDALFSSALACCGRDNSSSWWPLADGAVGAAATPVGDPLTSVRCVLHAGFTWG